MIMTSMETRLKPHQEQSLVHCPRCDSTHTKFCYYNNYSLSQPRYYCKSCRRYWTKGGTLRNIPVGGVSRKNKKLSLTSRKPTTTSNHHRQQRPVSPNSNSLQLSYSESAAVLYPSFMEGGVGGEYDYGGGYLPATVTNCGYGEDTHELNLFGEMENYENLMNGVDVKPRAFALEWQEQTGCRSDEGRNGSSGYLMGIGSHGPG